MKKALSIPALWARMTFWGGAGIILAAFGLELGLLAHGLDDVRAGTLLSFSELTDGAGLEVVCRVAFLIMAVFLLLSVRAKRETLGRLRVSETASALWYAAVALGWLITLHAAELGGVLAGYGLFLRAVDPGVVSGQTLMLASYLDPALHGLMPLADWLAGAALAVLTLSLALTLAVDTAMMRRGRLFPFGSAVLAALWELNFGRFGAGTSVFCLIAAVAVGGLELWSLLAAGRGESQ